MLAFINSFVYVSRCTCFLKSVCACLQDCRPVSTVIFRVQGPDLADLLYAGTDTELRGCKLLQIFMSSVQQQLQQVPPQSAFAILF